jgi:hypothetical protein
LPLWEGVPLLHAIQAELKEEQRGDATATNFFAWAIHQPLASRNPRTGLRLPFCRPPPSFLRGTATGNACAPGRDGEVFSGSGGWIPLIS